MTTPGAPQNQPKWRGLAGALPGLLGLTAGLCTIFVLVVTVAEAWVEKAQARLA